MSISMFILLAAFLPLTSLALSTTKTSKSLHQRTASTNAPQLQTITSPSIPILKQEKNGIRQFSYMPQQVQPQTTIATAATTTINTAPILAATSTKSAWTNDLGDSALRNVQNLASKVATATNSRRSSSSSSSSNMATNRKDESNRRSGDRVQSALQSLEQDSEYDFYKTGFSRPFSYCPLN